MPTETEIRNLLLEKAMLPASLGRLEELSVRLGTMGAFDLEKPMLLLFAADHGITAEGVTHSAKAISYEMSRAFAHGYGAAGLFAYLNNVPMAVIDVGLDTDETDEAIINRKIAHGTKDFLFADAMTETEEETAFSIGSEMVEMAKDKGCDIVLFGEMGVGNSTAASAVIARLCSSGVEEVTTSASGLSADELSHKREVVKAGLALHPERKGKEVIRAFGGFETAAIAGAMVTASRLSIPILLDGMITNAAALAAVDMDERVKGHLIAGHRSAAAGADLALDVLGLSPVLELGMQLGEGTGALAAWPVVRLASHLVHGLKGFGELGVEDSTKNLQRLGLL